MKLLCLGMTFFLSIINGNYASTLHIHPTFTVNEVAEGITTAATDSEEMQFQEYLDSLFDTEGNTIDTNGWCTNRINCARFDYRLLTDTLKIPLIDTSKQRFFTYPLKNYVTSPFGPRRQYWHFGTDIKVFHRDTLHCAFDGIVRIVANDRNGYGKVVVVRHHYGLETLYGHMAITLVKNNQVLKSGDVIGLGGRTGRATGNHLHFEIRFCGEPFNPAAVLDYENYKLTSDTLAISRSTFEYIAALRKTMVYTVRPGDHLAKIARKYGTTIKKLCRLNGITPITVLQVGQKIIIRKNESAELISNTSVIPRKDS